MLLYNVKNKLAYKLIASILLFSGFITLIVAGIQLAIEYRRDVRYLDIQLDQIEKSFLAPLSSALWRYNEELVEAQLDGIRQFKDVEYAEVWDGQKILASTGRKAVQSGVSVAFPLTYEYQNQVRDLGELRISATYAGIYSRLYDRMFIILLSSAVKTFLTTFFMLALFQVLVMRHLEKIAAYFQSYTLSDPVKPLHLDRRKPETGNGDEFHRIEAAINQLIEYISDSYGHVQKLVDQKTDELEKTNEALRTEIQEREAAAARLRSSEEKFRNLIENSPDIVYRFSEKQGGVFVSRRVEKILGYTDAYMMANPFAWYDAVHEEEKETVKRAIQGAREGKRFDIEYRIKDREGRWHWFRDRSIGILDDEGGFVIEGIATDITEQKIANDALRRSEEKFRTIFIHSPIGISLIDPEKRPVMSNPALVKMMGYSDQELRQMTFREFTLPEDVGMEGDLYDDLFNNKISHYSIEKRNIRKDGKVIWVSLHAAAIQPKSGKPSLAVAMVQDITELKRSEDELRRSNKELEQFAYAASHDLQEPLRAIVGFLQLLQSRYEDQIDEKGRHYIERSVRAGHRMQTLINDLLALSRVNTRGAAFTRTDLNQIVSMAKENLQTIIQEKQAAIVCAELPTLAVDENQILSLFQNLMANGLKYNESETPSVEIGFSEEAGAYCFFVRDNGIGIAPKFHERIFRIFQRLHTDREYPGTGVGLSLCKKIVQRHGGRIRVVSESGKGATFYFTLPKKNINGADVFKEY